MTARKAEDGMVEGSASEQGGLRVRLALPGERCVVCDSTEEQFRAAWFGDGIVAVCHEHYHDIEAMLAGAEAGR